jgi:protein O-GlcNAc transferase
MNKGDDAMEEKEMSVVDMQKNILEYMRLKNYRAAEYLVKRLLSNKQENAYGQYLLAKILYEQKHFMLAIDRLNFIIAQLSYQLEKQGYFLLYQLLGFCFFALGRNKETVKYFLQASRVAADRVERARMYSNYLFISNYFDDLSDEELIRRHKGYGDIFTEADVYKHKKRQKEKLRIGYISPDFRKHIVVYFTYQLLSKYNKDRFQVICYARGPEDAVTEQLKELVDGWHNITNLADDAAAKLIYNDSIDILFDLSGHTANNCLPILAKKPAPVQISGIGYFNTTGLPAVDYFLTDIICDPEGEHDKDFTEELLRLPHSHFCYTPPDTVINCCNIYKVHETIVFGSFNNFSKITNHMLSVWLQILQKVPGSKLLLKSPHFDKKRDQDDICLRAMQLGFKADQLEIRSATVDYLIEYNDMDIALDTYPYPGGGTTCEALFMGVPVITLQGRRHGSRFGYSILKNVGLEELAVKTVEDYIEIAVALAMDRDLLKTLHKNLRRLMQASPLMNGKKYIVDVESIYEKIWQRWLAAK